MTYPRSATSSSNMRWPSAVIGGTARNPMVSVMGCSNRRRGPDPVGVRPRGAGSVGDDLDGDGDLAGDDVIHGGAGAGLLDERPQLLGRRVALDGEPDGDVLE